MWFWSARSADPEPQRDTSMQLTITKESSEIAEEMVLRVSVILLVLKKNLVVCIDKQKRLLDYRNLHQRKRLNRQN